MNTPIDASHLHYGRDDSGEVFGYVIFWKESISSPWKVLMETADGRWRDGANSTWMNLLERCKAEEYTECSDGKCLTKD